MAPAAAAPGRPATGRRRGGCLIAERPAGWGAGPYFTLCQAAGGQPAVGGRGGSGAAAAVPLAPRATPAQTTCMLRPRLL